MDDENGEEEEQECEVEDFEGGEEEGGVWESDKVVEGTCGEELPDIEDDEKVDDEKADDEKADDEKSVVPQLVCDNPGCQYLMHSEGLAFGTFCCIRCAVNYCRMDLWSNY